MAQGFTSIGGVDRVLLASAARTVTTNGTDQSDGGFSRMALVINVSVLAFGVPGGTWRFAMTAGNANSQTYSVTAQLMM